MTDAGQISAVPARTEGGDVARLGINTTSTFTKIKRTAQSGMGFALKAATFLGIALVGGGLSSWYAINEGTRFNTERVGPWVKWSNAGKPEADPYSQARFGHRSELIFNANLVARYEATTDSGGRMLHSSCDYRLQGMRVPGRWWSLAVFDAAGRLIPNPAQRYGYNSSTVMRRPDGSFVITLARDAQPQNWIPTTRAGRLIVVLEIQQSSGTASVQTQHDGIVLPELRRVGCR